VRDFETNLNQLRLVELATLVVKEIDNPQTHLEFLTDLIERVKEPQASALLLATLAHAKLLYGDMVGTKNDMDKCSKVGLRKYSDEISKY
jgi:26S proteasome regulatory subunit N9